jgi:hypothetical protein
MSGNKYYINKRYYKLINYKKSLNFIGYYNIMIEAKIVSTYIT